MVCRLVPDTGMTKGKKGKMSMAVWQRLVDDYGVALSFVCCDTTDPTSIP